MNIICQHCSVNFSTPSSARKFCSFPCSVKARNRSNWHQYDKRECVHCKASFEIISWSKKRFCSHRCGTSHKRGKENGRRIDVKKLRRKRVARIKINGKAIFLHRYLVERSVGRPLLPTEPVHHIDCDSFNNEISNLHLFSNEQDHQLAHSSIERLVAPLMKMGIVEFKEGTYRLGVALTAISTRAG